MPIRQKLNLRGLVLILFQKMFPFKQLLIFEDCYHQLIASSLPTILEVIEQ